MRDLMAWQALAKSRSRGAQRPSSSCVGGEEGACSQAWCLASLSTPRSSVKPRPSFFTLFPTLPAQVVIDKILILGLPGGPQGWSANLTAPGGGRLLPAAPGPLHEGRQGPRVALVVAVGLPVHADWSLQLLPPPSGMRTVGAMMLVPLLALIAVMSGLLGRAAWDRWRARRQGYQQLLELHGPGTETTPAEGKESELEEGERLPGGHGHTW